jgi:hypothetical protein
MTVRKFHIENISIDHSMFVLVNITSSSIMWNNNVAAKTKQVKNQKKMTFNKSLSTKYSWLFFISWIFSIILVFSRQLYVERVEKKRRCININCSTIRWKANFSSSIPTSSQWIDEDLPPNDLLCSLCKWVYTDAVITPCCHFSFGNAYKISNILNSYFFFS